MDTPSNVSEVQRSEHESRPVCTLTRIQPGTWDKQRLWWLWTKVASQDYAMDDAGKALGQQVFLVRLFDPNSEWYEIGDNGLAVIDSIIPKCNANVHFVTWDDIDLRELLVMHKILFDDLFTRHELNRLTAFIPAFNKPALRLAQLVGFRYEGEMRKAFLKQGTYHNIQFYGMLRSEFYRKEVTQ